jgi:hypothetical protein
MPSTRSELVSVHGEVWQPVSFGQPANACTDDCDADVVGDGAWHVGKLVAGSEAAQSDPSRRTVDECGRLLTADRLLNLCGPGAFPNAI